ncbi:hypothetical protein M9H77_00816 [Catharanthus roseus]|uniref:Uncharacterized protein n=1 Tax=Catharanthus roseus TaxID=4058 RepID=A0ACC0C422_CATRO|nr:hypothetical protein M9H77_00816 [Catharanthus roseus]
MVSNTTYNKVGGSEGGSFSDSGGSPRPGEDSPLLGMGERQLSSKPKTFANVFIAVVGAGVLGLPYTFKRTGWLTGLIMIFAVAALTYYCMMLLIQTRNKLLEPPHSYPQILSFGDLGFAVCGPVGRLAVDAMIVLSQAGFCVGYLIFIGDTLTNLFNNSSSSSSPDLNISAPVLAAANKIMGISAKSAYIWACFPFELGLNSIASLTVLAPLSIFADVVDLGAMGVVMADDSEMEDKSKFGKILGFTMLFIGLMYGSFGAMGYFAYGANTKEIITSNMGKGLMSTLVQMGLCINLFFTFPLMMNPVYEVFERRFWDGMYCLWLRWLLVLVVTLLALLVPNFADFLSLVGSSSCCVLGFVLPALFHYLIFKEETDRKGALFDLSIIIVGAVLGVSGTWYSLVEILT